MKILLTGADGFVGSNLKRFAAFDTVPFPFRDGDIENADFTGIDAVVHLGALVHRKSVADEREYFRVNADRTFLLAEKAKQAGVGMFLFLSTVKVYGESSPESCFNEKSLCSPSDPYGKSKLEAEKRLAQLCEKNFDVAIIRTPIVYGPGVKANILSLVKLIERVPLLPFGGIRNKRSFVYVGNLAALMQKVLTLHTSGTFLASDPCPLSTSELAGLIATGLKLRKKSVKVPLFGWLLKTARPALYEKLFGTLCVDASVTNRQLDFVPPYSPEEGWEKTIEWYLHVR